MNELVAIPHNGRIAREITPDMLAGAAKRFWAKVDRRGPDECWPWTGTTLATGYGRLKVAGHQVPATRLALHYAGRPIATNEYACHTCDNRPCTNPAHLFPGTHAENMADMFAKGRAPDFRGQRNPNAKLTPEQVREIRRRTGNKSQIAREFGVSATAIHNIQTGQKWRHVI